MKIALINENSQADKNSLIFSVLKETAEKFGHEVHNYGMFSSADETQITYVKIGLLAALILNAGAADYVVTGCGTGEGAMLACNSFPGVLCGHIVDPEDAFMFSQINDGNAISIPFAKGMGWGMEIRLKNIFESLLSTPPGGGYPKDRVVPEQRNKKILDQVKLVTHRDISTIIKELDRDFVKETVSSQQFAELFYSNCKSKEVADALLSLRIKEE